MKKTKLKFTAAVAALAMTFALAVTATGCSDGGDATNTDGTTTEDTSGGSTDSGAGSGSGSGSGSQSGSGSGSGTTTGGTTNPGDTGDSDSDEGTKEKPSIKKTLIAENGGFLALSKLADYSTAKLAIVLTNSVENSEKAGYGAGALVPQKSSDWSSPDGGSFCTGILTTPAVGKTKTFFIKISDIITAMESYSDYDGFYINVYNDATVTSVSIAEGVPDDKTADLTKLGGYDSTAGGLVKEFSDYKQYSAAFTIALEDLDIGLYNTIEIIGQVIVGSENKLTEWSENFGAFVGVASDVYNGASANNMGTAGHYISWTDATYDTLLIQANAGKCDKAIVTAINLSYSE